MPRSALLLLLVPSLALAQTTTNVVTATENSNDLDDEVINIDECNGVFASSFTFSWNNVTQGIDGIDLRVSDQTGCPLASNSNTTVKTQSLGRFGLSGTSPARSAPSLVTLLGFGCNDNILRTLFVCAVGQLGSTDVTGATLTGSIRIDQVKPTPPNVTGARPAESALEVNWELASNAERYVVRATPVAGGATVSSPDEGVTGTSHRLDGLENGVEYDVKVFSLSVGGNESDASDEVIRGTPQEVDDFWERYRKAGGQEQGGCATGRGGALALLGLVALALRRKRQ